MSLKNCALMHCSCLSCMTWDAPQFLTGISLVACLQAAREIAGTIATANNRVLLNSESLLLNLVSLCHIHA